MIAQAKQAAGQPQTTVHQKQAAEAVLICDPCGKILACSPAGTVLLASPPEKLLGRCLSSLLHVEAIEGEPDAEIASTEPARWPIEKRLSGRLNRTGKSPLFVTLVISPVSPGGQEQLVVSLREADEDPNQRQHLLELFQDAVESIPNGFAIYDRDDRLVLCNNAFASFFDTPPRNLAGTPASQFHNRLEQRRHPAESQRSDEAASSERWLGRDTRDPVDVQLRNGKWKQITRHSLKLGGSVYVRTDITRLKAAEASIKEGEALIRKVLEACPVPVGMTRASDGLIIYESPASQALFQRRPSPSQPEYSRDYFVNPKDRDRYLAGLAEEGKLENFEVAFRKADGSTFWAALSAQLIDYQGKKVIVSSTLDLTERRTLESEIERRREALYQSEKLSALGGLLAGVAHELNNPLSVVVGQATLLQETCQDQKIAERAAKIGSAADRCARIVRTFLAMARKRPPERSSVNLNDIVLATLDVTGYALRTSNIDVTLKLADNLSTVWADADQLNQVVTNLVINAQQAMTESSDKGRLTISTRFDKSRKEVVLVVDDTGPGIPPEARSRIFEPFFTTKQTGHGTGIGLSVSMGFVETHGGSLTLSRRKRGAGAAFTVRLPITGPCPAAAQPSKAAPNACTACRILVIDDEPEILATLQEILKLDGHCVTTSGSAVSALALMEEKEFDLILSDLRMPELDGPGLYQALKWKAPSLIERMAFITGDTLGRRARRFLKDTGRPCLEKPFTPNDVRALIHDQQQRTHQGSTQDD